MKYVCGPKATNDNLNHYIFPGLISIATKVVLGRN